MTQTATPEKPPTAEKPAAPDRLSPLRDRLAEVGAMLQWEAKPRGVPFRLECWISRAKNVNLIQIWDKGHGWSAYGELDQTNNSAATLGKII